MRRWLVLGLALVRCATTAPAVAGPLDAHHEPDLVTVRHTVEPGQTLYRISKAYGLTVEELMTANGIEDPKDLMILSRMCWW